MIDEMNGYRSILWAVATSLVACQGFSAAKPSRGTGLGNSLTAVDLENPRTRTKVLVEAIKWSDLVIGGDGLHYHRRSKTLYTGWVKYTWGFREDGRGLMRFEKGKKNGLLVSWYDNGRKALEDHYVNGRLRSSASWKPNGVKCPLTKVVNGDGIRIVYEMNGRKQCQGAYVGGLAHGLWTMWPDDGTTRQVGHYKQGKEDGVWHYYDRFGKITHSETWTNGELIEGSP